MTYYKGATLGKMMVGITVKADDFQKLSFGRVLLRETIGKFVSSIILGIGYIIAGVTQRKQALHDKFAHSVVVYKDPSNPSKAGLIIGIIIAAILPALAILGILASVVLVSLNVARQKGQDAKIMSELNSIRASAELYYSTNNNSYSQTRSCSSGMFADQNIQQLITGMSSKKVMCYAEGSSYSISSALSDSTKSYCVDNSGFGGSGTASDNGSEAVCTPMAPATVSNQTTTTNQNTPSIQTSSTGAYSYTLPSGWLVAQNGPQGMQALNQSSGYLLSITATAIPSLYGNITSVDQVTSVDQLKSSLIKKYPNATIVSVSTGTIGGKKAYLMNYYMSASDLTGTQNQSQSKQMSITEYTTVNNGSIYTLAFISALSDKASAQSNLQTIVDSLKFKQ
jgi:Tfp pilus assembly protein PilE